LNFTSGLSAADRQSVADYAAAAIREFRFKANAPDCQASAPSDEEVSAWARSLFCMCGNNVGLVSAMLRGMKAQWEADGTLLFDATWVRRAADVPQAPSE
jgi:hypothetical protein